MKNVMSKIHHGLSNQFEKLYFQPFLVRKGFRTFILKRCLDATLVLNFLRRFSKVHISTLARPHQNIDTIINEAILDQLGCIILVIPQLKGPALRKVMIFFDFFLRI